LKWNNAILYEDYMLRVNAAILRGTMMQYKTRLFYGWRQVAKELKKQRIGMMVRTWNCLCKNRQYSQIKRLTTQLVLRKGLCEQETLIRVCFNAMRVNKE